MLITETYDLIDEGHKVKDALNKDGRIFVDYKVVHAFDKELGLLCSVDLTFQPTNEAWEPEQNYNKRRVIEFFYGGEFMTDALSEPNIKVIKIHRIADGARFCYVVDYIIEL